MLFINTLHETLQYRGKKTNPVSQVHFFNQMHHAKHWIYKCTSVLALAETQHFESFKAAAWNRWVTDYKSLLQMENYYKYFTTSHLDQNSA